MYQSDDELSLYQMNLFLSKHTTAKLMPRAATTVHFVICLKIQILYFITDKSSTKILNFNVNCCLNILVPT